ncbi:hypothetical protein [Flavobacterium kingsejongi]|nr:hypothetical protein [Flavobacterium kingsejongi]
MKTAKTATDDLTQQNDKLEYDIREGDKVSVLLGYDQNNVKRFEGYVKRVNMSIPVKVECEGYNWLLYDKMFNKSYKSVTVKQILTELCQDTDIVLSPEIPEIPLRNVFFKNSTGVQVLEFLKKECRLAVYFNFNVLYVGTLYGQQQEVVKFRLGWNTVKEDNFKLRNVDKNVRIVIREKDPNGHVHKTQADVRKYSDEKVVKVKAGIRGDLLKDIVNRLQTTANYNGYEGDITVFLEPAVTKGMIAEIDGYKYPEKSGRFFVESVDGEFSKSGGRQTIGLGFLSPKK